jgi:protein TonB
MNRVGSTGVQGFFAALIIHLAGFGALFLIPPPEKSKATVRPPVKVRVADRPEPPPPPVETEQTPEVKDPIEVKPDKPLKKRVARVKKSPAPKPAAPASPATPSTPPPATTPRKFTVAMEATVPGGGVSVPASSGGGWTFGSPDGDAEGEKKLAGPAPEPPKEKKQGPPPPRDVAGVTRLPRLISQPSNLDMRAAYPEAARRENREANVYLKILVTADGKVAQVRVVRGAGEGFDQAAVKLVKQFRFRPAEADGQAVSVWIPWTYKFRLEG